MRVFAVLLFLIVASSGNCTSNRNQTSRHINIHCNSSDDWTECFMCSRFNPRFEQSPLQFHRHFLSNQLASKHRGKSVSRNLDQAANDISSTTKDIFDQIYTKEFWGTTGGGSGDGSDMYAAAVVIQNLQLFIFKYNILSLIDAPCGAVSSSWMRRLLLEIRAKLPCFVYYGVDVVESVIRQNSLAFPSDSGISFSTMDLSSVSSSPPPPPSSSPSIPHSSPQSSLPLHHDAILSRDAMQHLSYRDIARAFTNFCKTNSRYLLLGSYLLSPQNENIQTGGYFNVNFEKPPFMFKGAIETFAEEGYGRYYIRCKKKDEKRSWFSKLFGPKNLACNIDYSAKFLVLYSLPDLCASDNYKQFVNKYK